VVESPRGRDGKQEEHRLRADRGQDGAAPQAMEVRMTAMKETHQPPNGQTHVQGHVRHVEHTNEPLSRQEQRLQLGLEVEAKTPLQRDDSLGVAGCEAAPLLGDDEAPDQQVGGVHAQA
jgi:hypothetical protein